MDRRTAVPARAGGVTVLLALLLVMGGAVTALALRAAHLVGTLPAARPEPYVELLAVAIGAAAATWVAASALLGLGCVVVRAVGRSWGAGERLLLRAAPAVVRRAARAGVGLTVGAGLVLAGGTAQAAAPPPPPPRGGGGGAGGGGAAPPPRHAGGADPPPHPPDGAPAPAATTPDLDPGAVAVDLGWQASTPAPEPAGPAQPAPLPTDVSSPAPPHAPSALATTFDQPVPMIAAPTAGPADHASSAPAAPSMPSVTPDAPSTAPSGPSDPAPAQAAAHETAPGTATSTGPSAPARAPGARSASTEQRDAALTVVRDVAADEPREVVVVRGDSLWSIAARHLPDGASDAQVADAVQRWYAANVGVVGDDPDLVRPGQVLVAPTS
ncbi:LysM peptidoglycan-binding domain-containing protein [Cellulosimicrobium cellulans]|uniref:LysM peptidoglycan-binding domain-containing protein n=1 Tax=Cellulosimicrobium cellulans TaxID=1710 RepID=UPI003652F83A